MLLLALYGDGLFSSLPLSDTVLTRFTKREFLELKLEMAEEASKADMVAWRGFGWRNSAHRREAERLRRELAKLGTPPLDFRNWR